MPATTLAEMLTRDSSRVRLNKASVKVPILKLKKKRIAKVKKDDKIPLASVIDILIKSAVENAKRKDIAKTPADSSRKYEVLQDKKEFSGGYGSHSNRYGTSPQKSYIDYEKLFSYLGKFRSQNAFENFGQEFSRSDRSIDGSFLLIDKETIEAGTRYAKYFSKGQDMYTTWLSLVPIAGMSSAEWEKFRLLMIIDKAMYTLKVSTS